MKSLGGGGGCAVALPESSPCARASTSAPASDVKAHTLSEEERLSLRDLRDANLREPPKLRSLPKIPKRSKRVFLAKKAKKHIAKKAAKAARKTSYGRSPTRCPMAACPTKVDGSPERQRRSSSFIRRRTSSTLWTFAIGDLAVRLGVAALVSEL